VDQSNSQLLQAQAQLAQAEANQVKAQLDEDRFVPLARDGVVAKQEMDNAVQANLAAKAQVKAASAAVETAKSVIGAAKAAVTAAEAAVKTAQINLGFTKIYSPIDGIAGIAQAQVGNLIQPNNPNSGALTTISTVDPIKVYFTLSEQDYLSFTRRTSIQNKLGANDGSDLELVLADGTVYPQKGRFFVADRQVEQKTGTLRIAGLFPNAGNILRPGQYGRVRALTSLKKDALVVPQRAVTELQGNYQVAVVGPDNKVDIRSVKVGNQMDSTLVIEDGLKAGESIVVEGTQKVRPGAVVNPKPVAVSSVSVK